MKKWFLFILPLVAILLSAIAWWWIQPSPQVKTSILPLANNCQLHTGNCLIEHNGMSVRLSISPQPIPIAKALTITADIQGVAPTQVQLDINGSNMYMGYNRVSLTPTSGTQWTGKSILSFCTIDEMQWQLTLLIDLADGQQIQAPFPLVTPFKLKSTP